MLPRPKLLLVDEPTSALDVIASRSLLDRLKGMSAEQGCSIVFVTHNMDAAAYAADTIYIMQSGSIVEHGGVGDVLHRPSQPYTKVLLDAVPYLT